MRLSVAPAAAHCSELLAADQSQARPAPINIAELLHCRGGRVRQQHSFFEIRGGERPRLRDQTPRGVDLLPDVPQQDPTHPTFLEVIDHPLAERFLPIRNSLEPSI